MATFREDIIAFIKQQAVQQGKVCDKFGYQTRGDADITRHLLNHSRVRENKKLANTIEAYRCKACGLWHLGHNTLGKQRRFRRSTRGRA